MTETQNARTLIATFKDYSTARQAARELEDAGVPGTAVHLESNQRTAGAGSTGYQEQEHHAGGFKEWWNRLFGSNENDDDRSVYSDYEGAISRGSTVLRATIAAEAVDTAVDILNRHGAQDIGRASTPGGTIAGNAAANTNKGPVPVIEEELQVGKRAVRRGGVRVFSHVVSQPVEEQVRLREEHVNVERRKVDREISPDEVNALHDQTIEVTEMAEEPVVGKRARIREEVVVGKEASERTETVRDNVRRTEVEVQPLGTQGQPTGGGADLTEDYRRDFRQRFGSDRDFAAMQPAYEYGSRIAVDPQYKGRSWDEVESDLRSDYERSNPSGKWEQAKHSVRYGWDRMRNKR